MSFKGDVPRQNGLLFVPMRACRSWQAYVDEHLLVDLPNGGQLSSAAIVGADGGVWAQSPTFPAITADEVRSRALASPAPVPEPTSSV